VSIGPILGVPGIAEAVRQSSAAVIGFAGILGGAPVLGMAHRLLPAIGVAVDAASIGLHYGPRTAGGVLDVWTMDLRDASTAAAVEQAGLRVAVTDLVMSDPAATAAFVHYAVKTAWS
jgi:LPPG:FO 2-phospho-L-lactate transferase